ncbi:aspartate--tRNA ligase msd1 [Cryptotrichosporon argae]
MRVPAPVIRVGALSRVSLSRASARPIVRQATRIQVRHDSTATLKPYVEPAGLRAHLGPREQISHGIADLSASLQSQTVVLGGWLFSQRRASENLHFFTLRSGGASVQLVVRDPSAAKELMSYPLESVVQVSGVVQPRKQKAKASEASQPADEVEVEVTQATLLNPADENLPFYPNRPELANEDLRAQYRYLDLRRAELANNLQLRSKIAHIIRCHLHDRGFTEVETPILLQSSPEGAREFLVPTRVSSSSSSSSSAPAFYALPQSPQQPKQLLIASGAVPRYFQLAKCFRDEDGRKDRQPEFTQVDIEMGFVSGAPPSATNGGDGMRSTWAIGGQEVRETVEGLVKRIWKEVKGEELEGWFRVIPYDIAMDVYGSDKPDTRFEMYTLPIGYYPALTDDAIDKVLMDQSPSTVEFMVTPAALAAGLDVGAMASANQFIDHVRITESNMYTWHKESVLTLPLGLSLEPGRPGGVQPGDVVWLSRRKKIAEGGWTHLGRLRVQIMETLVAKGLMALPPTPHFLWVTQFPLFTRADEDKAFLARGRWSATHHPFTAPMHDDLADLKAGKVDAVRGQHYDLVLNGQEIGGGSVRIHDARLQEYVMRDVLELTDDEVGRFGHLLRALRFGAPPHAGLALGFDRLVAILAGARTIRDVIAFPKTGAGADPVFRSPSSSSADVLREYGLRSLGDAQEDK